MICASSANHFAVDFKNLFAESYNLEVVGARDSLRDAIAASPPHVLIFHYGDSEFAPDHASAIEFIQWLQAKLPEIHIIGFAATEDLSGASELLGFGMYDCLSWPASLPVLVNQSIDRAIESDLRRYSQEDGAESLESIENWNEVILNTSNQDEALDALLREVSRAYEDAEVLYLKYVPGTFALVADRGLGWSASELAGVGIDLKSTEAHFKLFQLQTPNELVGLAEFVREGLRRKSFQAFPLNVDKSIHGLVLVVSKQPVLPTASAASFAKICISICGQRMTEMSLKSKLEKQSIVDDVSEALNRQFFMKKIHEEISRARRISKPVCLLIIKIDSYFDFNLAHDPADVERFLKSFTALVSDNSRPTDLFGRLSEDQFGLVLPHTDSRGGAIKAERLRRIVEGADFSRVIADEVQITVSIGVSEYPAMSEGPSELLKTADSALTEVMRTSRNKVCLASIAKDFVPDFTSAGGK
jgi:diguanylate cyclase (GGDEF)-like protein